MHQGIHGAYLHTFRNFTSRDLGGMAATEQAARDDDEYYTDLARAWEKSDRLRRRATVRSMVN